MLICRHMMTGTLNTIRIKSSVVSVIYWPNSRSHPGLWPSRIHRISCKMDGPVAWLCQHAILDIRSTSSFPQLRTTPLAGYRFSSHIRALLLFGSYLPPPATLSAAVNVPPANRTTRVPQEIFTDAVIEDIKTQRCCSMSDALESSLSDVRASSPAGDDPSDNEPPPSSDPAMSDTTESEFSIISNPIHPASGGEARHENHLQVLANMYMRHSTATDLHMRVVPPASQQTGTGHGTLIIPGWVRKHAAEVLFEGGDLDESSVAEVILDALLKSQGKYSE
ncbi:hypothetical protein BDR07DRAFT_1614521 [Suillus spraguei]|nr:hypothetical protein BDR07DRAFT_1614521 [Suillus spraguei]